MKRTALYYPTISVPTGPWLRSALLYWDEVASIVPQDWEEKVLIPFSPDLEFLKNEGEFRPIRPDMLVMRGPGLQVRSFEEELKSRIKGAAFQHYLDKGQKRLDARVHIDKVSSKLYHQFLEPAGLAREQDNNWYLFERRTALLYMSCLAKYLAEIDKEATIPGTDVPEYEALVLDALSPAKSFTCLDMHFRKVLPVPRKDVSFQDILDFKRDRREELLKFREQLDEFQSKLSKAETKGDIKEVCVSTGEKLENGIKNLMELLKDRKLATVATSFKTIASVKSPTLWGTVGVGAGHATKIAELPIERMGAGLALLGAIEIGHHLVDSRNKKRAELRETPFAYLYHAKREGIV